ncbi:MAG: co-chaperone GroES [Oligoflexia bacterium]|nr:co-chaperone GroES [Oligoflexia bacterium]
MSEKGKKKQFLLEEHPVDPQLLPELIPSRSRTNIDAKRIRKISPVGMRVVVLLRKESNQTDTGLYLPEGAKSAMAESLLAEVIEVASAIDSHTDEETNVSGIPLGALVLIPKDAGVKVPWDDDLRIVETKSILAIINEVGIT